MAGPWEKYEAVDEAPVKRGPWEKYVPEGERVPELRAAPSGDAVSDLWNRAMETFRDPEKESAEAVQALVDSEALGISPSTAHRLQDTIDRGIEINPQAAMRQSTFRERVDQSWQIGVQQNQVGEMGYQFVITGDPQWLKAAEDVNMPGPGEILIPESRLEEHVRSAAKLLPMTVDIATEAGWKGVAVGSGFGLIAMVAGQPELVAPMAMAGLTIGGTEGLFEGALRKEAGLAVVELATLEDEEGNRLDPDIARAASFGIGSINAGLEVAGFKILLKTIPGMDRLLRKAISDTATSKTVRRQMADLGALYAGTVARETGIEVAQESVNVIFGELAKNLNNEIRGTDIDPASADEIVRRLYATARESAQGFSVIAAPGVVLKAGGALLDRKGREELAARQKEIDVERAAGALEELGLPEEAAVAGAEDLADQVAKARRVFVEGEAPRPEVETRVVENVARQLRTAGVTPEAAQVQAEVFFGEPFRIMAERAGIGIEELAEEFAPRIRGVEELGLPEAVVVPTVEEFTAQRLEVAPEQPVEALEAEYERIYGGRAPGETLFQPTRGRPPRAQITFGLEGVDITLLEGADPSSFIHETGHLYIRMLDSLVTREGVSQELVDDHGVVLDWLGARAGQPLTRGQQEKWARGFESYLRDGSAPTPELRNAFAKFREWLTAVYETALQLNVDLTPEVRDVMGRLLAERSEIEIKAEIEGVSKELERLARPLPRGRVKGVVRRATGLERTARLISEDEALAAAWKKAEQASRKAFKAGKEAGVIRERERMAKIIARAKTRLRETARVNQLKKAIIREIKAAKVKRVAGKPVGKFTPEVQEVLDKFTEALKLTEEQALGRIADNLERYIGKEVPDEVGLENRILDMVVRLQEIPEPVDAWVVKKPGIEKALRIFETEAEANTFKDEFKGPGIVEVERRPGKLPEKRPALRKVFTPKELESLLDGIREMKETGKVLNELRKFNRKSRHTVMVNDAIDVILGGEELPAGIETVGVTQKKPPVKEFKAWLQNFTSNLGVHFVGWNDMMDMMSARDKTSKPGESRLNKMAEVHTQENAEKAGRSKATQKVADIAREAFDFKSDRELLQRFNLDAQEIAIGDFNNAVGVRVSLTMTKAEARKLMMEYADPTLRATFHEGMNYTEDMIQAIRRVLSPQDLDFMERQMKFYREYYDRVNSVYRGEYGVNLPFNEFYTPIQREGLIAPEGLYGEFLDEVSYRRSVGSGSLKSRVRNLRRLARRSDVNVLERHIADMEHFIAWSEKVRDLNAVFKNPDVRAAIKLHHDPSMLFVIDKFLNDFTRGGVEMSGRLNWLDKFRGNFTRSVLAAKASITIKQLTSVVAYMEVMPVKDFVKGTLDFWTSPIKNVRFLKKNSIWFAERGAHMERDIKTATRMREYKAYLKTRGFMDSLMLNVTLGDQGAIAIGGWAYYKYLVEKKGMSPAKAIIEFERFSEMTQQSSDLSLQSDIQRMGSFAKLFSMFLSAPNLYMRKELGAVRNLMAGRGSKLGHMKTIAIYHMVLPMFFQLVTDMFDWDEENQKRAVIMGPLNGIFIIGDGIEYFVSRALGQRAFPMQVAILSVFEDLSKFTTEAIEWVAEGEMTDEDFYRAIRGLAGFMGALTGTPLKQAVDQVKTGQDFIDGEHEKAIKELLGYSPHMVGKHDSETSGIR